jgi:LemA protein
MKKLLVVLGVLVAIVVVAGGVILGQYNNLVTLNEQITGRWSEVENQLQRRGDLIPNLVNTVKGYAKHEKGIFEDVAAARAQLAGARTVDEKIKANQQVDGALSRLLAIAENYPQLKADANFRQLQDELAGTENRIAVARNRYNETVQSYNIATRRFPGNIIAGIFNFGRKDVYYKAEEKAKALPQVQF